MCLVAQEAGGQLGPVPALGSLSPQECARDKPQRWRLGFLAVAKMSGSSAHLERCLGPARHPAISAAVGICCDGDIGTLRFTLWGNEGWLKLAVGESSQGCVKELSNVTLR